MPNLCYNNTMSMEEYSEISNNSEIIEECNETIQRLLYEDEFVNLGNDYEKKLSVIKRSNPLSLELRLCLFSAALFSLKSTTLLKPYPDIYYDKSKNEVDVDKMREIFDRINTKNKNYYDQTTIDLIHWIMSYGNIGLEPIDFNSMECQAKFTLKTNLNCGRSSFKPKYIFKVSESVENRRAKIKNFEKLKNEFGSFYAFHGSGLENFHSILHNGLAISLNKRSLFGFGTYLSYKLQTAIVYSPFGYHYYLWNNWLGRKLSLVALCEIADSGHVKTHKNTKNSTDSFPETYCVVTNNDSIRVAYLLVYSSHHDKRTNQYQIRNHLPSICVLAVVLIALFAFGYMFSQTKTLNG